VVSYIFKERCLYVNQEINLIDKLEVNQSLTKEEWIYLIDNRTNKLANYLSERARKIRQEHYGKDVYIRGLIELTNYCKQDCLYCGIRKSNLEVNRYRLSDEEVLECCREGYELGFRTFVLQGGEDEFYTDERLIPLIKNIRQLFPQCAITLSLGERTKESYQALYQAGANRYLLRHETAHKDHYKKLHLGNLTAKSRQESLWQLKEIGYEVGSGFMVSSPYQTTENLAYDMLFLKELNPQMIGIGPFIPHHATPFKGERAGGLELTIFMIGLLRLMIPKVLLPATTSLGTIARDGREQGVLAGANVIMPNLTPMKVRKNYLLYDDKICTTDQPYDSYANVVNSMESIGYKVVVTRGNSLNTDNDVRGENHV
jgi:biotin synthase